MRPVSTSRVAAAVAGIALLVSACGDTSPTDPVAAPSPTSEATAGATSPAPGPDTTSPPTPQTSAPTPQASAPTPQASVTTPTPAASPAPADGPCDGEPRTFTVTATNFQFAPGRLDDVCVGDTIVLRNEGGSHTLKETTGSTRESESTGSGESASLVVEDSGTYDFFCGFHPQQMRTSVDVVG